LKVKTDNFLKITGKAQKKPKHESTKKVAILCSACYKDNLPGRQQNLAMMSEISQQFGLESVLLYTSEDTTVCLVTILNITPGQRKRLQECWSKATTGASSQSVFIFYSMDMVLVVIYSALMAYLIPHAIVTCK
jgi:hypothetical protein